MVGRDHADRNDVIGAGDNSFRGHRDYRIVITGGERVAEISEIIRQKRLHEREVRTKRGFEQIAFSSDFDALLASLNRGPDACLC